MLIAQQHKSVSDGHVYAIDGHAGSPGSPMQQLAGMGLGMVQEGSRKPQEAFVMALWGLWLMVSVVIIAWHLIAWIIRIVSVIAWMAMLDVCPC